VSEIHVTAPLTGTGSESAAAAGHDPGPGASHVHTFFDKDQFPASHFEDAEQQRESASLGMWAFLATEVMLFAGLFVVYALYRVYYHEGFVYGSHQLNVYMGTANTFVLLASSMCVVMAVHSAHKNSNRGIVAWLLLTMVFGLIFFVVKGFEWKEKYDHGLIPWINWDAGHNGANNFQVRMFMVLYFVMTGTHAVHMVVGMVILAVLAWKAKQGKFTSARYTALENGGLYWHFVDIVWVFLVPTLYLIDLYANVGAHH
jgi:cytochrome c oxidase subunit 3